MVKKGMEYGKKGMGYGKKEWVIVRKGMGCG